jgi:hypothetical protein
LTVSTAHPFIQETEGITPENIFRKRNWTEKKMHGNGALVRVL